LIFKRRFTRRSCGDLSGFSKRNQGLLVLNAFGADRRRKSDSVFRINTPRVRMKKGSETIVLNLFHESAQERT
jgi:hypothetical protein